jgi:hypothetical protein
MKCNNCGDLLYSVEAARNIETARKMALQGILQSKPISAFLSAAETAVYLDISKQALHKHRRIRRGFIFQTEFGGKIVYLKKSVELFKKTGDGRFELQQSSGDKLQYSQGVKLQQLYNPYPEVILPHVFPDVVYSQ